MAAHESEDQPVQTGFPATRWTRVRAAHPDGSEHARLDALQALCLDYWYPLYAWARRAGWSEEDAKDLIQGFFEQLLTKNLLQFADPEKGRLRTFLLTCLKRHAGDLHDKTQAFKRDARQTISLDFEWAEGRYHDHQNESASADRLYDRRWAHALLQLSLDTLRQELTTADRGAEFDALESFLGFEADESVSYKMAAERLHIGEAALKSRVFRLRKRFHEIVKANVAQTLRGGNSVKDELLELMSAV